MPDGNVKIRLTAAQALHEFGEGRPYYQPGVHSDGPLAGSGMAMVTAES